MNTYYYLSLLIASSKGEQAKDEMVKDVNDQILRDGVEVRRRWAEYFEHELNVADVREANINVVSNWRIPVMGDLNERAVVVVDRPFGPFLATNC